VYGADSPCPSSGPSSGRLLRQSTSACKLRLPVQERACDSVTLGHDHAMCHVNSYLARHFTSDQEMVLLRNILEATTRVTFFNSGFKSDPTEIFPSIVLVIAGEKKFPPLNFNLKIVRIQRGGGSWMLLDAVLHCINTVIEECYNT
jgi:hypothetical protein